MTDRDRTSDLDRYRVGEWELEPSPPSRLSMAIWRRKPNGDLVSIAGPRPGTVIPSGSRAEERLTQAAKVYDITIPDLRPGDLGGETRVAAAAPPQNPERRADWAEALLQTLSPDENVRREGRAALERYQKEQT